MRRPDESRVSESELLKCVGSVGNTFTRRDDLEFDEIDQCLS
jgi:hypothetical protein